MIFKKCTYPVTINRTSIPGKSGGRPKVKNSLRHQLLLQCSTLIIGECLQASIRYKDNIRSYVMHANRELSPMVFSTRCDEKVISVIRVA